MENSLPQKDNLSSFKKDQADNNYQYFLEYKKIYDLAINLTHHLHLSRKRQQDFYQHISQLSERSENFRDSIRGNQPEKRRKARRAADQIDKQYTCTDPHCDR